MNKYKTNHIISGMKIVFSFCFAYLLAFNGPLLNAKSIKEGVCELNKGHLKNAKTMFTEISQKSTNSIFTRAIAYKHLATVKFRLGEDPWGDFDTASKLFEAELQKNNSLEIQKQYVYSLYQKANCLLAASENELRQAQLHGFQTIPFNYIQKYIFPATAALNKLEKIYPKDQFSDVILLQVDLALSEARVWNICGQKDSAYRLIERGQQLIAKALNTSSIASDTKKKLLLRKAAFLMEGDIQTNSSVQEIKAILEEATKIESGNIELDSAVFCFYARVLLTNGILKTTDEFKDLEHKTTNYVDELEKLRVSNVENMDFISRKNYFATRTELYEILMEIYFAQKRPYDMLVAINSVRSRAIQDMIKSPMIPTEKDLHSILTQNKEMLIAYYVGVNNVWFVSFTGGRAETWKSKFSGQDVAMMCWNVIDVFSGLQHLQTYCRYGNQYNAVPVAFALSNRLYQDLFEPLCNEFTSKKLKHMYIMPSNVLNYLPFATLVSKLDPNNCLNSTYIADLEIPITYLSTLNSLQMSAQQNSNAPKLLLTRGDYSYPSFYTNDPQNPDNPKAQPLNLPGVTQEGTAVANLLKIPQKKWLKEKQASEYNLFSQATKHHSIVHIASHAHLIPFSPLESYVVLSAGNGEDGKVKVKELFSKYSNKLNVDLLVLSACDTNRGESKIQPGDDIAALSNAFLVAGAKNIIATQWPASDSTFPQIMTLFYGNLQKGQNHSQALASALKQFLNGGEIVFRYPIFWGNIVLTGGKQ